MAWLFDSRVTVRMPACLSCLSQPNSGNLLLGTLNTLKTDGKLQDPPAFALTALALTMMLCCCLDRTVSLTPVAPNCSPLSHRHSNQTHIFLYILCSAFTAGAHSQIPQIPPKFLNFPVSQHITVVLSFLSLTPSVQAHLTSTHNSGREKLVVYAVSAPWERSTKRRWPTWSTISCSRPRYVCRGTHFRLWESAPSGLQQNKCRDIANIYVTSVGAPKGRLDGIQ